MNNKICGLCAYLKNDSPMKDDDRWICHHAHGRYTYCRPEDKGCKQMSDEVNEKNWVEVTLEGINFKY